MKPAAACGAVCLLISSVACTSALKEPPPMAELGAPEAQTGVERRDEGSVLVRARAEFDKMPDPIAVHRAQSLYLDAARVDGAPVEAFIGAARATAWLV